jgi:hypothetical protein
MSAHLYQQINLYRPIFRRQKQIFSSAVMLQAIGIFTVALLTIYVYGLWQVRGLEAEAVQMEGRERAYAARLAGLDTSSGGARRREVDDEIRRLSATLIQQQRLIEVLGDQPLGRTEGFSAHIAALARRHRPGLWLTSVTINGTSNAIELAGQSVAPELVPEYLLTLGEEQALAGQRFDRFDIERLEDKSGVVFHVSSRMVSAQSADAGANR